jgi:hypothetical protein
MYYISYYNTPTIREEILHGFVLDENGLRNPTGLRQDCLGMTPLHILACSTACLELYQLMVDYYPENLIVEDSWGAIPLLYAVWGDAPREVVQFLVRSYQSHYPSHEFNWTSMIMTLGRANALVSAIEHLLDIQQTLSPECSIDWNQVLVVLAVRRTSMNEHQASPATYCFLTSCSISTRVNVIGVKHFRDAMADDWKGREDDFNRQEWRAETITKLQYYECEYQKLKESTSLLELALWKIEMGNIEDHGYIMVGGSKKMTVDLSDLRQQCRISCGADYVIENVLPFLLPPDFVRTFVHIEDDDDNDDDEDDDDDDEDDDDDDDDDIEEESFDNYHDDDDNVIDDVDDEVEDNSEDLEELGLR